MSPAPDSSTVDPQEIIADLQRELADCSAKLDLRSAELSEALEQQTATAEVLEVINSSPGNLAPVFDAMVEKAMRLCDAANGVLRTFDGELFHLVSAHGDPDAVKRLRELGPIRPSSFFWAPIARGDPIVHITDVRHTDAYRQQGARER